MFHVKLSHNKTYNKNKVEGALLSKQKVYTIKDYNIVSDKGAKTKLKITKSTHTTSGGVGDLTTASKQLIVQLVDNINNINNLLHYEGVNRFVKSYIKDQAKSSDKQILGNLYKKHL